jgi:hypothetical protein
MDDRWIEFRLFYSSKSLDLRWLTFWGRVPKFSINFEDIFSRANVNFEEHNVLDSFTVIVNYFTIIINAYYS